MHRTGTTAQRRQTTARPRSSRLALALGLLALVTAACRDATSPEVTAPNFLISDAAHSAGKPHFYFLPPLVAAPEVSGAFDPDLAPAVEICALAGSDCGAVVATFTMTTGPGSETVRLDAAAEHYVVNWHTDLFGLDPAVTYRIRVLVGEVELGFADVDVVSSGQELRNVNTGEFIPLRDGRTLPIKFRVELGFLARVDVVPVAATVAPAGTQQFMAVLTDLHGDVLSGPPVAWASSNEAGATVDQTGLATAVGAGVVTITATAARVTGKAQLTVVDGFIVVGAGGSHSCALGTAGQAYCWGRNFGGQLGDGTTLNRLVPVPVAGGLSFTSLSAGLAHTCGVTTGAQAYCWGFNVQRQLGDGTTNNRLVPVAVAGGLSFASVSAGQVHTCGVTTGGQAYCWGANGFASADGRLGNGTTQLSSALPTLVAGGLSFAAVSAGSFHSCGVTTAGQAYCWGARARLGAGFDLQSLVPVAVAGGLTFATLSTSGNHTCGVTTLGRAYCWGPRAFLGELGNGTTGTALSPVAVAGGLTFASVSAGGNHTCGATAAREAYCWGSNGNGQLGDGTTVTRLVPVAVAGGLEFVTVSAGGSHSCGTTADRKAYCWGRGDSGERGDGTIAGSLIPVAVSFP